MLQWEYKRIAMNVGEFVKPDLETRLNELGAEGWELTGIAQQERHGYSGDVHLLFRRERRA